MKSFKEKFKIIQGLKQPQNRGLQFEKLFYKIFDSKNILLESSYKNEGGSQQIDGAIEINNRIFIIEIKWEKTETLAASKLYSFLGKINSKIEGTLGLFISYHELSDNFLEAVRTGIKQNCIIIHGKGNIIPIIHGEISIPEYIWYIYQQAATKNRVTVPVSEFKSIPQKKQLTESTDGWEKIYTALTSEGTVGHFELLLEEHINNVDNLPEKTIILYPLLKKNRSTKEKIKFLFDLLLDDNKNILIDALIKKLKSNQWLKYSDNELMSIIEKPSKLKEKDADKVAENALSYLRENFGQWEEENKASFVIDFVFDHLSVKTKNRVYCAYSSIYCDIRRQNNFPQKQFANKIFGEIEPEDYWDIIQDEITFLMEQIKSDYMIFEDESEKMIKTNVIDRISYIFKKIIKEIDPDDVEDTMDDIYEQV